jgi:ectoine hydroxylase-related dioxygenase (phytanoyl-CoA dioxygenase family)
VATGEASPKERYARDGFLIHPEPVLAPDLCARAAAALTDVRAGIYDTGAPPDGRAWNPGDDPKVLCKIEQPQISSTALQEALRSPLLGAVAGAVTGAQAVQVWWVQGLYKPGDPAGVARAQVGWHQDLSYWSAWEEGSELFTAWLALSDVGPESGPMVFVPGSHRWGLLPGGDFFGQDQDALRAAISLPEGEAWSEVPNILPPGGVSFHDRLLFHGSMKNRTTAPRISLAIHLRTDRSQPKPDSWVAKYLDRPEICPWIYGAATL